MTRRHAICNSLKGYKVRSDDIKVPVTREQPFRVGMSDEGFLPLIRTHGLPKCRMKYFTILCRCRRLQSSVFDFLNKEFFNVDNQQQPHLD